MHGARTTALTFAVVLGFDALLTGFVLPDDLFGLVETERQARIYSPLYHHDLAPNRKIENARWGALRYGFSTNSLGFKDRAVREVPLTSTSNRLLVMGDSFSEGNGFGFDDTFAGVIDQKFKQKYSQNPVEVLNGAVSSYSPAIYYRKIQHLLGERGLSVDAVAVFIDISDIDDEARGVRLNDVGNVVPRGISGGDATLQQAELRARAVLKQYSSLYRLISALNRQRKAKLTHTNMCQQALALADGSADSLDAEFFREALVNPRSQWTWNEKLYQAWGEKGLAEAGRNMTRLRNFLAARDIPLIVSVYPWPEQIFQRETNSPQVQFWRQWADDQDAHFLDLFPAFINADEPLTVYQRYFVPCDVHWNQDGHKMVAEKFFDFFRSLDLKAFPAEGLGHNDQRS